MTEREIKYFATLIKTTMSKKIIYVCSLIVATHATTGKYKESETNTTDVQTALGRYYFDEVKKDVKNPTRC